MLTDLVSVGLTPVDLLQVEDVVPVAIPLGESAGGGGGRGERDEIASRLGRQVVVGILYLFRFSDRVKSWN